VCTRPLRLCARRVHDGFGPSSLIVIRPEKL
jgi:hypothetical protein